MATLQPKVTETHQRAFWKQLILQNLWVEVYAILMQSISRKTYITQTVDIAVI